MAKKHVKIHTDAAGLGAELVGEYTTEEILQKIDEAQSVDRRWVTLRSDESEDNQAEISIIASRVVCVVVRDFEKFKALRDRLRREAMLAQAQGLVPG